MDDCADCGVRFPRGTECPDCTVPTCDICDEADPEGGPDWNGDTGCHRSCEAAA